MQGLRSHLTYANVMVTLLAIGALTGGVAYAANTIGSSDIIDESILSRDVKNGQVQSVDLGNNQVQSVDVRDDGLSNGGLTGADIKDQSGVDTCTHGTVRYDELCVEIPPQQDQGWFQALDLCASLDLRLPSIGEAKVLAVNNDLPTIADTESFWTDHYYVTSSDIAEAFLQYDSGATGSFGVGAAEKIVCVTTPTN